MDAVHEARHTATSSARQKYTPSAMRSDVVVCSWHRSGPGRASAHVRPSVCTKVGRKPCHRMSGTAIYPKLIVPLQIDLAIEVRRYLLDCSANVGPGDEGRSQRTAGRATPTVDARVLARHSVSIGRQRDDRAWVRQPIAQMPVRSADWCRCPARPTGFPRCPPRHLPSAGRLSLPPRRGPRRCGRRPARKRRW